MSWRCSGADNLELIRNLCRNRIIKSKAVENAMLNVDRKYYASRKPYEDSPQSIGFNATISAPHMHAYALEWIHEALGSSDGTSRRPRKVLDVGCGSGYLSACLSKMGYNVFGIDHIQGLVELSRKNLSDENPDYENSVKILLRDGFKGLEEEAPFDAIRTYSFFFPSNPQRQQQHTHTHTHSDVGAAAPTLPDTLVKQLRPGGRMIIPVGTEKQQIYAIDKASDGNVTSRPLLGVRYIPLTTPEKQLRGV